MNEESHLYLMSFILFIFGCIFIYTPDEVKIIAWIILVPLFTVIVGVTQ